MLEIGERIRVENKDNNNTRIAIIAIINDNNTVDLNDEDNVDITRIKPLLNFELILSSSYNALEEKEYGNQLFILKDYNASISRYKRSLLLLLQNNVISVGSEVLVSEVNNYQCYRFGMISDINNDTYDIIYDETFDYYNENDNNDNLINEESNVLLNRIFNLSSSSLSLSCNINGISKTDICINIQKAVLMNLAKCYYQQGKYGLAIRSISLHLAIVNIIEHTNNNNNSNNSNSSSSNKDDFKKKADAYYIKAKSFILSGRPNLARKVIKILQKYDKQRSDVLLKETDNFIVKRQKENKQLAKHIASWIDTAMTINEKKSKNINNDDYYDEDEDDIYIKEDIDDKNDITHHSSIVDNNTDNNNKNQDNDNNKNQDNGGKDNEKCFIS